MARRSGSHASRYTTKKIGGVEVKLPHCVDCDDLIEKVKIPVVSLVTKDTKHPKKYPWFEVAAVCNPCRQRRGEDGDKFIMFPCPEGVDTKTTLRNLLESLDK